MKIINAGNLNATMQIVKQYAKEGSQTSWAKANHGSYIELWRKLRQTLAYTPDPDGKEVIRSVDETLKAKKADCEDFSILISAILLQKKINHAFRIYDYGRGWEHIAVVLSDGTVIDAVNDRYNNEVKYVKKKDYEIKPISLGLGRINIKAMKPKQLKIQFKNGLGKLPTSLILDRERFTLTLWAYFVENGAKYMLENKRRDFSDEYSKGYTNDLPKNITDLNELVRILRSNMFGVDAELIPGKEIEGKRYRSNERQRIQKPDTIKVSLGKQTFSFDPYYLADSVFRAYGIEGLAPKKKAVVSTEQDLSPNNEKLMALMKPFVGTDDLRPAMKGVYFDENGVAATDAHKLLWIKGKSIDNGIFEPKTLKKIDERFPQYLSIIPEKQLLSFTVDPKEFAKTLLSLEPSFKEVKSYVKRKPITCILNKGIVELIHDNEDYKIDIRLKVNTDYSGPKFVFGFDLIHMKAFLNSVVKLTNPKSLTIDFTADNRCFTIETRTPFGDCYFLLMPLMIDNGKYPHDREEFKKLANEYLETPKSAPTPNKAFIMAKAKAKLKLLALNF